MTQETELSEEDFDKELDAVIAEMRKDGLSDEDILEVFAQLEEEASTEEEGEEKKDEEPKLDPIPLMEVADSIINQEPGKLTMLFDKAIKDRLALMVDDYKKHLASTMFDESEEGPEDPEDEEDQDELEFEDDEE